MVQYLSGSPFLAKLLLTLAFSSVAADHPVFVVSSVKLNNAGDPGSSGSLRNGHYRGTNVSLLGLIKTAYDVPAPRIFGGPKWLSSEHFDIEAKGDAQTAAHLDTLDREQRRLQTQSMFQQLLADRFKLAVHSESRTLPVYALVVAKKGFLLHPWKESDGGTGTNQHNDELTVTGVTLPELAWTLTQDLSTDLGRVVVDKTGIEGRYNGTLHWTPEREADPASPDAAPSVFTAIQEQLGLKLESAKAPVQVLVIDHAEMPGQN